MSHYRFYIEPLTESANEAIAELLNRRADSAESLMETRLPVAGRADPITAYEAPEHYILTIIKRSGYMEHFRVYVQERTGVIRQYHHFQEKKSALQQSFAVKMANQRLAARRRRRKK
jgi:Flp pilus assembly CpaF family ATPase